MLPLLVFFFFSFFLSPCSFYFPFSFYARVTLYLVKGWVDSTLSPPVPASKIHTVDQNTKTSKYLFFFARNRCNRYFTISYLKKLCSTNATIIKAMTLSGGKRMGALNTLHLFPMIPRPFSDILRIRDSR